MVQRLVLLSMICVLAQPALAAGCTDGNCTPSPLEAARNELDTVYEQLKAQWPGDNLYRKRLINTQRAWRALRDAECDLVTTPHDPADHIDAYEQCLQTMTLTRARALQYYLKCAKDEKICGVATP